MLEVFLPGVDFLLDEAKPSLETEDTASLRINRATLLDVLRVVVLLELGLVQHLGQSANAQVLRIAVGG